MPKWSKKIRRFITFQVSCEELMKRHEEACGMLFPTSSEVAKISGIGPERQSSPCS